MPGFKDSKLRILVLGYVVRGPIGGLAWHHLQYVLGLARLGHDVLFLEDSDDYPACYNPVTGEVTTDPAYGLQFADSAFKRLELKNQWAYYDAHANQWFGKSRAEMFDFFAASDILLNLSGVNPLREWLLPIPRRALIDTDPAFTQIRHLTDDGARMLAAKHTHFFTFGENFGGADCLIPDDGFDWKATRQPIVADVWQVAEPKKDARWTTVMQWDSYRSRHYGGMVFGMKSASFDRYLDLPKLTGEKFELAVGSPNAPRDLLKKNGWKVTNPLVPTRTPWTYQKFIRDSKAEWTIAKHGYAASRSGWFSERSAAYLASGRPVLTEETGFSNFVESGRGLLSFSSKETALAGIEEISNRYAEHCRAAREIAERYFDYRAVLSKLINDILN